MPTNPSAKAHFHRTFTIMLLLAIPAYLGGILGCAGSAGHLPLAPPAKVLYWPTDGWKRSTPEQQGMDSAILADALNTIRKRNLALHSLMIVRHGYVVLDAFFYPYSGEAIHDVASVTKSVTATLIQIALEKGTFRLPMGLDGVYRFSEMGPSRQTVAIKGSWIAKDTFTLRYTEVAGVNHFEIRIVFEAGKALISLHDPSGYFNGTIAGHIQPWTIVR